MEEFDELKNLVYRGALDKKLEITDRELDQINHELEIIKQLKLVEYFLIYAKIIQICNRLELLRSYGRGSAGSSFVNYCLDITKLNPLDEGLIFERFINPDISKNVDIDIDIPEGTQNILIDSLKKEIPNYIIKKLAFKPDREVEWYKKLNHNHEVYSVHPCALIISKETLNFDISENQTGSYYISKNYEKDSKYFQEFKYDLLELEYLNTLDKVSRSLTAENHPYKLCLNDKKVFDYFTTANLKGVFQFETEGCQKILKQFEPQNIYDLAIVNAMFRPGLINYIPDLIRNKKIGGSDAFYSDDIVMELLNQTYGLLIYQETFMHLAHRAAGFTYNEADYYRRLLCRNKDKNRIEEFSKKFNAGCYLNSNLNGLEINKLEQLILTMMPYSFNKSHSLCYSILGYWGAYYKANFESELR